MRFGEEVKELMLRNIYHKDKCLAPNHWCDLNSSPSIICIHQVGSKSKPLQQTTAQH